MDNAAIKAAVEASRRVTETIELKLPDSDYVGTIDEGGEPVAVPQIVVGTRTFTLRLPSLHEVDMAYLRARGPGVSHEAATEACMRVLLERAIVGWTEVVTSDLVPDAPREPLPWSADLVPLLLDETDWAGELKDRMVTRLSTRKIKTAAAQKN